MNKNSIGHEFVGKPLNVDQLELSVLEFWDQDQTFQKSVEQRPQDKPYIFYDGPPFATGTPHYGHILASTAKDLIPRYYTMKGFRVERVWGWDCHGLPIENIVEKELDLYGGKKGIEELGIDNFNQACRQAIWRFDKHWEKIIRRIGRWVDFKNSYKTMDVGYMESVWWAFKMLYDKNLVYQGRKVILYCPRCATPLSNFEIAMDNSYKELPSPSTTYKYKVKGQSNTYLLAWSTTPWNKLATPALAVNPDLEYSKIKQGDNYFILATKTIQTAIKKEPKYKVVETFEGKLLEELEFETHYNFYPVPQGQKSGVVIADNYVSAEEGTGIVTLAVYGEDDYRVMKQHNIHLIEHVDDQGHIKPEVTPFAGMFILKVNKLVNQDLESRGLIYSDHEVVHRVPVCYRCETRLYQAPIPAWFIDIAKLKPRLIAANLDINWYPDHLKTGRFGKGLETAPDWNISRSRYWGTPMPIWIGASAGGSRVRVIGSIDDLKKWAVDPKQAKNLTDIHREFVDEIEVWVDDEKTIKGKRIPEVFDCWVESGSMPFASLGYPNTNKDKFESRYPADYIAEYIAQTRAWFYTLHVMSVALFDKPAFENAVTTGNILAADGRKMSKSKKNFPDPEPFFQKYGVDALRFYLMASPVMRADNINFNELDVKEIYQKLTNIVWNMLGFHHLYAKPISLQDVAIIEQKDKQSLDVVDHWILTRTDLLVKETTDYLDHYNTIAYARAILEYVSDLSTWYLRRSRERIKEREDSAQVFGYALLKLSLVMAPITPFMAEVVYQNILATNESVHLAKWPELQERFDESLLTNMKHVRQIVEALHNLRQESKQKIRQPLPVWGMDSTLAKQLTSMPKLLEVVGQELNVKTFKIFDDKDLSTNPQIKSSELNLEGVLGKVFLDTTLSVSLIAEGQAREIVRKVQDERKKAKIKVDQPILLTLPDWPKEFESFIKDKTLAEAIKVGTDIAVEPITGNT